MEVLTSSLVVEKLRSVVQGVRIGELAIHADSKGNAVANRAKVASPVARIARTLDALIVRRRGIERTNALASPTKRGRIRTRTRCHAQRISAKRPASRDFAPESKEKAKHAADDSGSDDDSPGSPARNTSRCPSIDDKEPRRPNDGFSTQA